jgi:PmbA protein
VNYEKYTVKRRTTTVNVVQTKVDSVKRSDIVRTGLRVFDGKCIGVAGALGGFDEADLGRKAEAALARGVSYPWEISGERSEKIAVPADLPDDREFVTEMDFILRELRLRHPELYFSNNGKLVDVQVSLENDRGLDLEYSACYVSLGFGFKHRDSTGIMDGWVEFDGFRYERPGIMENLCRPCEAFGKRVDLPEAGTLPVIFSCDDILPLRKLLYDLSGKQYGSGSSLLAGRIGEKVFSHRFTLTQTADHMTRPRPFFDAEGVVNEGYRYPLVEEGVVRAAYTDRRTADRFSLPLTGSAGALYDSVPALAPARMRVEDTGQTLSEILDGEPGILVSFASGGDFTPEGRFGSPVQLAYLHDGVEFLGRLPELRISSDLFGMFGDGFRGCSSDSMSSITEDRHLVCDMEVETIG